MMLMVKRIFALVVILFSLGELAMAASPAKLTIALARNTITPGEENYMYAVPKQLGYFAAQGIDVSVLPTDGSTAAIQALASGSADIAFASSANIAAAIDKGVPIIAFAGITIEWPYFIGVAASSNIKTLQDLKGKRIGVISLASASYNDLIANLKLVGIDKADVTIIPVGSGIRAANALKNDQVDAIDSYTDSFTLMEQHGLDLRFLPRPAEMDKLFSVTMATTKKLLAEEPEKLIAYTKAAYMGTIYTTLYPKDALQYSFKEFPQLAGSDDINSTAAKDTMEAMRIALAYSIPKNQANPKAWGKWLDLPNARWQAVLNFAHNSGLTERLLSVDEIWDGRLMDKIYDFNVDDISQKPHQPGQ